MVARAQPLTAPKVGPALAGTILLKDRINAQCAQGAQQKIRDVKCIAYE
jgi:hypothetical protein